MYGSFGYKLKGSFSSASPNPALNPLFLITNNQPAYHSKFNGSGFAETCGCSTCPLKTEIRGPAQGAPAGEDDIIDETLFYFRANVLFRNFDVRGSADRTLAYLTLFAVQCLVKCEKIDDKPTAVRELRNLAEKPFSVPGEPGFPFGGLFKTPDSVSEKDSFKAYFKQARIELTIRLADRLFDADGSKNKWWQSFSKRRFMGKEMPN